jgi:hypothetical protein
MARNAPAAAVLVVACALLTACGGGGGSSHGVLQTSDPVALQFVIPPKSTASTSSRKPAYISPLTDSIAVTVYPVNSSPPSTPTTVANVGSGEPGCISSASAGTSCTVTVNSPPGNDTFIVSAYAGTNGTGTLLSQATVGADVTVGMAPISVTLTQVGATVTGDMLGYVASRTWTYTVASGPNNYTGFTYPETGGNSGYSGYTGYGAPTTAILGVYADPTVTNGVTTFVAFVDPSGTGNPFSLSNEATNPNNCYECVGAMGVQSTGNGYLVYSYGSMSNYSFGTLPGTPLLVPSSMQLGQTWNPVANTAMGLGVSITATVTAVGQVPGIQYCPGSASAGATVQYTMTPIGGSVTNTSVSYVPGCGITDYIASTGSEFRLSAVGSQSLGTLDIARKTASATLLGTLHTLWQRVFVKHAP